MIGYPNVGKSSTINSLFGKKAVGISETPGKTKSVQTLFLGSAQICDCPGLVFPSLAATKQDLVLNGVLSIDQTRDTKACIDLVLERVALRDVCFILGVQKFRNDSRYNCTENFLFALRESTGCPEEGKDVKKVIKAYVSGNIRYSHPPPGLCPKAFNSGNHQVPNEYKISEEKDHSWFNRQAEKPQLSPEEEKKQNERLMYSKKHYLKKRLARPVFRN